MKTILDGDINSLGEGDIIKKLLMLQNLKLKYNAQSQIVSKINLEQNLEQNYVNEAKFILSPRGAKETDIVNCR